MKSAALFIFLLLSFSAYSQLINISGTVKDTTTGKPVVSAVAMAVKLSDSLLVKYTRTNQQGFFNLIIPADTYQLIISHPGFGDQFFLLLGSSKNDSIQLKDIAMPSKSITMQEVTILGYTSPLYKKGDTLVYVADSFKVKEDAVVEDLLKKLPGVNVDANGKIYVKGKEVNTVLVDGDEFFGTDPTIATKNLDAKNIETVNVYEKKENNGDGEKTLQVMDLKLKEDAKKGYFGKMQAGSDFLKYYDGELFANKFKNKQKLSVFAMGGNSRHSKIGWQDRNEYGLQDADATMGIDGNYYSSLSNNNGLPKGIKAGMYISDYITKKANISFNYTYNKKNVFYQSKEQSKYFLPDSIYHKISSNDADNTNEIHKTKTSLFINIDSLTELRLDNSTNFSSDKNTSRDNLSFLNSTTVPFKTSYVYKKYSGDEFYSRSFFNATRKFKNNKDRYFTNYAVYQYNNKSNEEVMTNNNNYFFNNLPNDSLNQKKESNLESYFVSNNIIFCNPITKKHQNNVSYYFSKYNSVTGKKVNELSNGEYNFLNQGLSNNFKNTVTFHMISLQYRYKSRNITTHINFNGKKTQSKRINLLIDSVTEVNYLLASPFIYFYYDFTENRALNLRYSINNREPQLEQLQPVSDNSNPNFIRIGNPDLLPEIYHNINLQFNDYKPMSGSSVWLNLDYNYYIRNISQAIYYDPLGRTIYKYVNSKGNMNFSSELYTGHPLYKKIAMLYFSLKSSYFETNNIINYKENRSKNLNLSPSCGISFDNDKIAVSYENTFNYVLPINSLNNTEINKYYIVSNNVDFVLPLPKKIKFSANINHNYNSRKIPGTNNNLWLLGCDIEKKLLKNDALSIKFKSYDLLNVSTNVSRSTMDNVVIDKSSNQIGRYFMLFIAYKFKNKSKNTANDETSE